MCLLVLITVFLYSFTCHIKYGIKLVSDQIKCKQMFFYQKKKNVKKRIVSLVDVELDKGFSRIIAARDKKRNCLFGKC